MKIVKYDVGRDAHIKEIEYTLEAMQAEVGGYIEVVRIADGVVLVCNENALLKDDIRPNRNFIDADGRRVLICDDCFMCATDGEDFTGLTDKLAEKYAGLYKWAIQSI